MIMQKKTFLLIWFRLDNAKCLMAILQVLVYVSVSCKIETPCLHFSSDQTHRMEIAKKSNQQLISVEKPTAV